MSNLDDPPTTTVVAETDYHVTDRDVVVGDQTNTRLANRLLGDLVALHQQLGHLQDETLDDSSQRLVKLLTNGMEGVNFLSGKGQFAKISGIASTIASDEEAFNFVKTMLKEEMKTVIEELQDQEGEVEVTIENGVHENGEAARAKIAGTEGKANLTDSGSGDLDKGEPGDYDVKIATDKNHSGNIRFQKFVKKYTSDDKVTIMAPHSSRVKATRRILRRTKELANETWKARFMRQEKNGSWSVLDDKEAAEFIICCIFDALLQSSSSSSPPASSEDLKSLIPSIGSAELSQFLDFSKPSTTPVEEPTEFDVLFGRGGMTNSHVGNKRFRDIISLHRPDYVRAVKIEKPNVARRIVAAIRGGDPPGRFMKRNPNDLMWYDVGNRHATEKTSQALREKSQSEKNGMVPGTSEADVRNRLLEQALSEARATRLRLGKEGGSKIGNCLDPTTFKLLTNPPEKAAEPETRGPTDDPNVVSNGDAKKSDTKDSMKKQSDKLVQKLPLVRDLKDVKISDTGGSIDPSSSIGIVDDKGDIVVTENDILCGRGGLTNHHKGNKRFRDVVALHRPDYVRASKVQKPAVARMIVKAIRNSDPPGRFLKKDSKIDKWVDIGDKRAAEKASQALREKPPEERGKLRQFDSDESASKTDEKQTGVFPKDEETLDTEVHVEAGEATNESSKCSHKNGMKEAESDDDKSKTMLNTDSDDGKSKKVLNTDSDDERSKEKLKTDVNETDLGKVVAM